MIIRLELECSYDIVCTAAHGQYILVMKLDLGCWYHTVCTAAHKEYILMIMRLDHGVSMIMCVLQLMRNT